MTATPLQAKDEMLEVFKTAWDADPVSTGLIIKYPDVLGPIPSSNDAWVEVLVQHNVGGEANLQGTGSTRRYRSAGFLLFRIMTPTLEGLDLAGQLAEVTVKAFETAKSKSVRYFASTPNFVGNDGAWHQTNVVVEFEYDTFR